MHGEDTFSCPFDCYLEHNVPVKADHLQCTPLGPEGVNSCIAGLPQRIPLKMYVESRRLLMNGKHVPSIKKIILNEIRQTNE